MFILLTKGDSAFVHSSIAIYIPDCKLFENHFGRRGWGRGGVEGGGGVIAFSSKKV